MRTKKPTIRLVIEKNRQLKSDGRIPIVIQINWKGTRAKERTGFYINESELDCFELPENIKNRLNDLENVSKKLMEERRMLRMKGVNYNFTARDILDYNKPVVEELFENESYKVYIHILPNNSIYIGITKEKLNDRWKNGDGYKDNKLFYYNIQKYGWNNIKHLLFKDNLSETEAKIIEKDLITFYSNNEIATGRLVLNLQHNKKRKPILNS